MSFKHVFPAVVLLFSIGVLDLHQTEQIINNCCFVITEGLPSLVVRPLFTWNQSSSHETTLPFQNCFPLNSFVTFTPMKLSILLVAGAEGGIGRGSGYRSLNLGRVSGQVIGQLGDIDVGTKQVG